MKKGITTKSRMIFTQENEYSAVLDACVLVPVSPCDLLLRLGEEPAMYRPLWSEQILAEMVRALRSKLHRTAAEAAWRREQMVNAFPEAMVPIPPELLKAAECIPDEDDRHVLAAAIMARANVVITQNTKHFPKRCLEPFGILCQTADEFLVHQFHLRVVGSYDFHRDDLMLRSATQCRKLEPWRNAQPRSATSCKSPAKL